jgi:excisionase family DNA binding protein
MRPPPSPSPIPPDAILLSEAAELLGLAVCSVWRRLRDGSVRAWRVGNGRWRVSRAEVLALVTMNAPAPEALGRAELAARAEETDRVLRAEKVRR